MSEEDVQEQEVVGEEAAGELEGGADEAPVLDNVFVPKVQVKEVEVKTLEEDEEVILKLRAKLYVFVAEDVYGGEVRQNWWRERGLGEIKVLKHKEMGKVRLLMRQDKTLKICLNHLISPGVELKPNVGSDRSWVFTARDFADEELKTETFAIKFASAENANLFRDTINAAKKVNAGEMDPSELKPVVQEESEKSEKAPAAPKDSGKGDDELAASLSNVKLNPPNLAGGFQSTSVENEEIQKAAEFAAGAIGKGSLVKVVEAAQQVVAGMNYLMRIHIKHDDDAIHAYTAKVYQPLPHTGEPMSLSQHNHEGAV